MSLATATRLLLAAGMKGTSPDLSLKDRQARITE